MLGTPEYHREALARIAHVLSQKVYCRFTQDAARLAVVWIPVPPGDQTALIGSAPRVYFRPPYVGVYGWVGIKLDQIEDEDLAVHLHSAWKMMGSEKASSRRRVEPRM